MKTSIYWLFINIITFLSKRTAVTRVDYRAEVLIVPPNGGKDDSFGDYLMLRGMQQNLLNRGRSTLLMSDVLPTSTLWKLLAHLNGSALKSLGWLCLVGAAARGRNVVAIGADTVTGRYGLRDISSFIVACNVSIAMGGRATLCNFSLDTGAARSEGLLDLLDDRVRVIPRDVNAFERARNFLSNVEAAMPDIAILGAALEIDSANNTLQEKNIRKKVFVLVTNAHLVTLGILDISSYVTALRAITHAARAQNFSVTVVNTGYSLPQEYRDINAYVEWENSVDQSYSNLDSQQLSKVLIDADYSISLRMHPGLFLIMARTPTLILEYNDKANGLLTWLGCSEHVVHISDLAHPEGLMGRLAHGHQCEAATKSIDLAEQLMGFQYL